MSIPELKIGGKYQIKSKIGSGTFGDIYLGINNANGETVAIKLENVNTKYPQLSYESKIMNSIKGGASIPKLLWYGQEGEYNILIMDLLGPNLENLFDHCKRKFTPKTVLMIADQLLQGIEYIHSRGYLHRDIKPENFLIGRGKKKSQIYFIDFGLSKRYIDSTTGDHIQNKFGKQLTGTARYVSINTHKGEEQSRRDDLECIAYLLVYFWKGTLPWQGLKAKTKLEKYQRIYESKVKSTPESLCKDMPVEFKKFFENVRSLKFDEKPDYKSYRTIFKDLFVREGYNMDYGFDWITTYPIDTSTEEKTVSSLNFNVIDKRTENFSNIKSQIPEEKRADYPENLRTELKEEKGLTTENSSPIKPQKLNFDSPNNSSKKDDKGCNIF